MKRWLCLIICLALGLAGTVQAGYVETWDGDPQDARGWNYYDSADPLGNGGDVPLTWNPTGGVGNSAWVETALGDVTTWALTGAGYYYIAYTYASSHLIDLIANPWVTVSLNNDDDVFLNGGSLVFWIGEFRTVGSNDFWSFFYLDQPLSAGDETWVQNWLYAPAGA